MLLIRHIQGEIYAVSNSHMPSLLKIGYTARPIDDRIREIESPTGVPGNFICKFLVHGDRLEPDEMAGLWCKNISTMQGAGRQNNLAERDISFAGEVERLYLDRKKFSLTVETCCQKSYRTVYLVNA